MNRFTRVFRRWYKYRRHTPILQITSAYASDIIEEYRPEGRFWFKEGALFHRVYIGIDNTTGDAWTEEFKSRRQCISWLKGDLDF